MSLTLHLGVDDIPYPDNAEGTTTGDVAEILEAKYGLFGAWFNHHDQQVADDLAEGAAASLESLLMGAPPNMDVFGSATSKIETNFRAALTTREVESYGLPGVPTQAALKGVSHRFKKPYAKRDRRPSFIDSGLLQATFRAWVD